MLPKCALEVVLAASKALALIGVKTQMVFLDGKKGERLSYTVKLEGISGLYEGICAESVRELTIVESCAIEFTSLPKPGAMEPVSGQKCPQEMMWGGYAPPRWTLPVKPIMT